MKQVVINADDYGLTNSCTKAIASAFCKGLITDTTMVANGPSFDMALTLARENHFDNHIGIHFNLTEGKPLTEDICKYSSFVENGVFHGKINRLKKLSVGERHAVYQELSAQIQRMEQAQISITHADSHHHIHTGVFIAPIVIRVCQEHSITKIRLHRNIGRIPIYKKIVKRMFNNWIRRLGFHSTTWFGSFDDVSTTGLRDNLEIMVHPDFDKSGTLIDRTDEFDGYPVGKPMFTLSGTHEIILKGYRNL